MGWIRHAHTTPAEHLHRTAGKVESESQKHALEQAEHVEMIESPSSYPILPKRTPEKDLPLISADEVKRQDGKDGRGLWIVIDNTVLECTTYVLRHPGGQQIIHGFGGQDASWQWWTFHDRKVWNEIAMSLRVGRTEGIENRHVKPKAFVGLRGFGYQDD